MLLGNEIRRQREGVLRTPHRWWFLGFALLLVPLEGHVSTHGSMVEARQGYSIAKDVSVGENSDHEYEARVYRERIESARNVARAHEKLFKEIFDAGVNRKGRFTRFFKYLDRKRTKALQSDYKVRFRLQWPDAVQDFAVYLHPKPRLDQMVEAKLAASFALNQLGAGGYYAKYAKFEASKQLDRLNWLLGGWQYTDMGNQLSHLLDATYKSPEPLSVEARKSPPTPESMLANLIQLAIKGESIPDEVVSAILNTKHANLISLLLMFAPDSDWDRVAKAVKAQSKTLYNYERLAPLLSG